MRKSHFSNKLVFLFLMALALTTQAFAAFDREGLEIQVGDRVLVYGANGYVRQIYALSEPTENDHSFYCKVVNPWFAPGIFRDRATLSSHTHQFDWLFKSIPEWEGARVGVRVKFRKMRFINECMRMTNDLEEGTVSELFSGGHLLIRTGFRTYVAINHRQLIYPGEPILIQTLWPCDRDAPTHFRLREPEPEYLLEFHGR